MRIRGLLGFHALALVLLTTAVPGLAQQDAAPPLPPPYRVLAAALEVAPDFLREFCCTASGYVLQDRRARGSILDPDRIGRDPLRPSWLEARLREHEWLVGLCREDAPWQCDLEPTQAVVQFDWRGNESDGHVQVVVFLRRPGEGPIGGAFEVDVLATFELREERWVLTEHRVTRVT